MHMDDNTLDNAISRHRRQFQPLSPSNLEQNVLRRIRVHRDQQTVEKPSFIGAIHQLLFVSGWVMPAVALAIVFSVFASTVAIAKSDPSQEKAARALGFDTLTASPRLHHDGIHR